MWQSRTPPDTATQAASAATDLSAAWPEALRIQLAGPQWGRPGAHVCGVLWPLGRDGCGFIGGMQATEAAAAGDVGKSSFAAMALRELSVGVCKGNYLMHQPLLGVLAGVTDRGFRPGADRLTKHMCD
jgi:hypothetical protein